VTSNANWQRIDALLAELLDLDRSEREIRLESLQRKDSELAARLQRLLAHAENSSLLGQADRPPIFLGGRTSSELAPGQKLGGWHLIRRVGQGGMAEVFEAERDLSGISQKAAIKVTASGRGGALEQARFHQEIEILAGLHDPRIARLIDAGRAPDGRCWLAMEYVEGQPIDRYCAGRLGVRARVELIIDMIAAVEHAHQQLIIHRDLKPDNILVNQKGEIRLLDFGIARIVQSEAVADQATHTALRAYTLRHASPEQLAGRVAGVGSDVYQIGILLYQLLTGQRPFSGRDDDPGQLLNAMRQGARPPSLAPGLIDFATRIPGSPSPRKLRALLKGDLDSIVLRALEYDSDRRHSDVASLRRDLENWLTGRPISGRSYSRIYRTRLYLKRHWLGAASAATLIALVIGYAVTVTVQSNRLEEQRNEARQALFRAEAMHGFLLDVIGSADPHLKASHGKSIDQVLVEAADSARETFVLQPELLASLLMDIGVVLMRRSRLDDAKRVLDEAWRLRRDRLGIDHEVTRGTVLPLAEALYRGGERSQALDLMYDHVASTEQLLGIDSDDYILSALYLAAYESEYVDNAAAEARVRALLDRHLSVHGDRIDDWAEPIVIRHSDILAQLGVILLRADRNKEALSVLEQVLVIKEQRHGAADQRTMATRKNIATSLQELGRIDEATSEFEKLLAIERQLYQSAHWRTAYTLGYLGNLARDSGDYARAIELWQESEIEMREAAGADHPFVLRAQFRAAHAMLQGPDPERGRLIIEAIAARTDLVDDTVTLARQTIEEYSISQ
jgi:eukaryotic-like serine/threonine-protein kinase